MKGKLYLIIGPSGAGKGTIIKALKQQMPELVLPISCTTRDPRTGEKDGEVYHFISKEDFLKKIEDGDFLEWAHVHGRDNFYGTLKSPILAALKSEKKVLREVDMQGAQSIRDLIELDKELSQYELVTIFITVKDWPTLEHRILNRSEMSQEELEKRRLSFIKEMEFGQTCDYVVDSREGLQEQAIDEVKAILDN